MQSASFDDRSRKVQQWLDLIFNDDEAADTDSSLSPSSASLNGSFSITSRQLSVDFEETEKVLESLEFLMQLNQEVESKCQQRDTALARSFDKSRNLNTACLNGSIFSNFAQTLRHVRYDRSAAENLRLLARIWQQCPTTTTHDDMAGHVDDACLNVDQFLLSVLSAMFRHEAEVDQKRVVLDSDCAYLEAQLRQLTADKHVLDEEFEKKWREKVQGNVQNEIDEYRREISFMRKKSQRYIRSESELKFNLYDICEYDPDTLSRSKLKEDGQRNEQLKAELAKVEKEVSRFRGLPSNIELARIRLEEAKMQLTELQKKVDEQFRN